MKIQETYYSSHSFKKIQLTKNEKKIAGELLAEISTCTSQQKANKIKNELLELFDKHIKKEVNSYIRTITHQEDYLQSLYLKFFELVDNIQAKTVSPKKFLDSYNLLLKPTTQDRKGESKHLEDKINADTDLRFIDRITEDDLPLYTTTKNKTEIKALKNELKGTLKDTGLGKAEKRVLMEIGSGKTFKKVSKKEDKSKTTVRNRFINGLVKLQQQQNNIPDNIKELEEIFKMSVDYIIKMGSRCPSIFTMDRDLLKKNISESSALFEVSEENFIKTAIKHPSIFYIKPSTLKKKIQEVSQILELSENECSKVFLKHPAIIIYKPKVLEKRFKNIVKELDVSRNELRKTIVSYPQVLFLKISTLKKNIKESAKICNISEEEFCKIALKTPNLLCIKTETLEHVRKTTEFVKAIENDRTPIPIYYKNEKNLFLHALTHLIKKDLGLKLIKTKNLVEIMNLIPSTQFNFKLPEHEVRDNFIKFTTDFFNKNFPQHACNFYNLDENPEIIKHEIPKKLILEPIKNRTSARASKQHEKFKQILELHAKGFGEKEIAQRLNFRIKTVKGYIKYSEEKSISIEDL